MPIIQYRCSDCEKEYEVFYKSQDERTREEENEVCPQCGSNKKEKLISTGTSFILKGPGWAKDRYGN
jgi:putative FmdB family regulatory protein